MEAFLTSPTGKTDLCEISDLEDSLYDIKFSPAEEGVHTVSLKHRGMHCSGSPYSIVTSCSLTSFRGFFFLGSPFQYTVGPPPSAGPYKVEIGGTGLEHGECGIKSKIPKAFSRE